MSSYCFWPPLFSMQNWLFILLKVLHIWIAFLLLLSRFLVFQQLDYLFVLISFSLYLFLEFNFQESRMCTSFIKYGKYFGSYSDTFSAPFSSPLLRLSIIQMLIHLIVSYRFPTLFFFIHFSFCSSDWIISVYLSWSWLILLPAYIYWKLPVNFSFHLL